MEREGKADTEKANVVNVANIGIADTKEVENVGSANIDRANTIKIDRVKIANLGIRDDLRSLAAVRQAVARQLVTGFSFSFFITIIFLFFLLNRISATLGYLYFLFHLCPWLPILQNVIFSPLSILIQRYQSSILTVWPH